MICVLTDSTLQWSFGFKCSGSLTWEQYSSHSFACVIVFCSHWVFGHVFLCFFLALVVMCMQSHESFVVLLGRFLMHGLQLCALR